MVRLPLTFTAIALVLLLAACGGGGGNGSVAQTPASNGSDADKGGDVLIPDGGDVGTGVGDELTARDAVAALTEKLTTRGGLDGWGINETLDKNVYTLGVSDEVALLFLWQDDGTQFLSVTSANVTATENGVSNFVSEDGTLFGKLNVLGENLDHSLFGYWANKTDNPVWGVDTIWGGQKTLVDDMPTGTATYAGKAVAMEYGADADQVPVVNELSGTLNATVNFDDMKFGATMDMKMADGSDWGQIKTIKGLAITGSGFKGDGFVSNPVSGQRHKSGYGKGQFNGPGAAEVVGTFGLNSNGMTNVRGAFGGKR